MVLVLPEVLRGGGGELGERDLACSALGRRLPLRNPFVLDTVLVLVLGEYWV